MAVPFDSLAGTLQQRRVDTGGYAPFAGEPARADATAWAALALAAQGKEIRGEDWQALRSSQKESGAVALLPDEHSGWVTTVALLAWKTGGVHPEAAEKAVRYLLAQAGDQRPKLEYDRAVIGHDANIRGWPWNENTHPWVDTTALALVALRLCGRRNEGCYEDGRLLLLDRQLPSGGWNYGNTFIYGAELRPTPESTGTALFALAGEVEEKEIARSLAYLRQAAAAAATPLTTAWCLLALQAWGAVDKAGVRQSLERTGAADADTAGRMPTEWVALLQLADLGWRPA